MLAKLKLAALLIIPVFLLILPADVFDQGQSICPSKLLLDKECPGCGITRGLQHLGHMDFQTAWEYNKLSYLVFPIAIYFWIKYVLLFYKNGFNQRKTD